MSAVETQLVPIGIRLLRLDQIEYEHNPHFLRANLDEITFAQSWAIGKERSLEQAITFALAQRMGLARREL